MARDTRRWYYRLKDDTWVTTKELAKILGLNPKSVITAYRSNWTGNIEKKLGYLPERTKTIPTITKKKPKYHIIYKVNNKYKYGICFGRGYNKNEAIEDFKDSRKDSGYKHKILFVTKDYDEARRYLLKLFEEENLCVR